MRAIVTGASSGLGKAIYYHLKGLDTRQTKGESEAASVAVFDEVVGVSRRGPDAFVDFHTEEGGYFARVAPCDVLVLNHGVLHFDEINNLEELVAVNLTSYYHTLQIACDPDRGGAHALMRPGGVIILNASVSGVTGEAEIPLYAALKAGVVNLARSYAKKLAAREIRVNAFSCGLFRTNLVVGETPPELIAKVPMRREAQPEEILPVIDMLIQAHYMTGQNVVIDGGVSL